jgi:DNA-binding IscR family transcriptional regulator
MSNWTLFSNHGHVLVCLASDSDARLRDVAADVGITERAVQKIVRDLQTNGMISVSKNGRRNRYRIHSKKNLRHELEAHCTLGELVRLVAGSKPAHREVKDNHIASSNDVPSTSVGAKPAIPETDQVDIGDTEPVAPDAVATESIEANPLKPKSAEPKSAKSIAPDSIERQQGSLF